METNIVQKQNKSLYKIKKLFKNNWKPALISFGTVFLVSILGSIFTNPNSAWFTSLIKPKFYPPNWLFGVMWSIIYLLIAIGLFLILTKNKMTKKLTILYIANGILNIVWSMVFFTFNNMFLGVVVLVLIIISAYFLVKELYLASKTSLYLALPYFIWLFYAFLVNYAIYFLN